MSKHAKLHTSEAVLDAYKKARRAAQNEYEDAVQDAQDKKDEALAPLEDELKRSKHEAKRMHDKRIADGWPKVVAEDQMELDLQEPRRKVEQASTPIVQAFQAALKAAQDKLDQARLDRLIAISATQETEDEAIKKLSGL